MSSGLGKRELVERACDKMSVGSLGNLSSSKGAGVQGRGKPWRITVMLGGPSAEREISIKSGRAVAGALRLLGHRVEELDPRDGPGWKLPDGTEVVFLALHGTYGEDGTVQAELDKLGVPYTGSGPEASRIAFDKILAKKKFLEAGVPTARFAVLKEATEEWPEGWRPPVVIKPARQGSSVGLEMVNETAQLRPAIERALAHDTEVLMEERIMGREATVGILEDRALPVIEVCPRDGVLDYEHKYTKGATEYYLPGRFDGATAMRVQEAALAAFRAVGARDYARVDVMVRSNGDPVVLEVNTLPGMTELSLLPKAAGAAGYSFGALCERMVELALKRRATVRG